MVGITRSGTPVEHRQRLMESISATAADGLRRTVDYRDTSVSPQSSYELRVARREGGDVVVVRRDTSALTAAGERIERLAYFDSLTELPNRQRCLDLGHELIASASDLASVAIIYMDLNGFKRINDTFGHETGDTILKSAARRLSATCAPFDTQSQNIVLTRFGGDEFVILLRAVEVRPFAVQVATACYKALQEPITYQGLEFYVTASVGLAVYPDDGKDLTTVLKRADTAMYEAKSTSATAVAVYSAAMSSRLRDWIELEARLRRALRDDGLSLHFQPKFSLTDNCIVGCEALLRWCDAEFGDIAPTRFIAIAEESGLILDIGSWVIRAACRQLRHWKNHGWCMPIAINVSAKELLHGDPAQILATEALAAGIDASLIEIEITESLLVSDAPRVRSALNRFKALGCRIALDDFGTGYSSLAYIAKFPPDRIKIDKSFVQNVDRNVSDAAIANAIISLGKDLNLLITAEGVERSGQQEWLRRRGCHEGQGFFFSRAISAASFEDQYLRPVSPVTAGSHTLPTHRFKS